MRIALPQPPPPAVVEPLDLEALLAAAKADLIARLPSVAPVLALESEPLTKLLEAAAYRELLYRQRVNDAARASLLAYATGTDLDHKGAFYDLPRMAGEDDERYRLRIQLRVRALAGHGTREAYELAALSASPKVRAAKATQPAPGSVLVLVWPLAPADGAAATDAVRAALLADGARILGVTLVVGFMRARAIDVPARLTREASAPANLVAQIAQALPARIESGAVLGRAFARSWLTAQLMAPGIAYVNWPTADQPPEFTALAADEYATAGSIELIDDGVAR